jgi:predicted dehydrogenase
MSIRAHKVSPSRRNFLKTSAVAAGLTLLPRGLSAASANGKLQVASIGVGGMGGADLEQISSHERVEIVGLCDIDAERLAAAHKLHPGAETFSDFRVMLETLGDKIDAVHVSTPDHTHAAAAMTAMNAGKHVHCQKPLTHDLFESRQLSLVSKAKGVVTQMGTQGHSGTTYRTAVATIRSGVLGKIREVHSWSHKTWGYTGETPQPQPVPKHISWNLWLGTAPERSYSAGHYHPGNWRRWVDFGCGTMGDMGIHILDPVITALDPGAPTKIVSFSPDPPADSFGVQNKVEYTFSSGSKQTADGFKLTWYDGASVPDITGWPVEKIPQQGSMFVGEKGFMLLPHVAKPTLLPEKQFADFELPVQPDDNHWHLWVDGCLGGKPTSANFGYAGPLTEILLLGVIANRFPTQYLEWDTKGLAIPNFADANALVKRTYRDGFEVDGLS